VDALHALLQHSIDYAGLFPPAGLDMASAVRNYASYRESPDAWALGRFVVPANRLQEFEAAAADVLPAAPGAAPWRLSALLGPALPTEVKTVGEFNCRLAANGAPAAVVDVVELKADSADMIGPATGQLPRQLQPYIEIPIDREPVHLVSAIGKSGTRAKVRTGGVTPDAFPRTADLVRFIQRCVGHGVPFKATAGLHHPLRAEYRLTYAPNSASAPMFGFLNLFLTAGFIRAGLAENDVARLLVEGSIEAIQFGSEAVTWQGHRLDLEHIGRTRRETIMAFGSCSFTEPIADLRALGLLQ
jgi:hypothetical protein